jgi:hypothetical protein
MGRLDPHLDPELKKQIEQAGAKAEQLAKKAVQTLNRTKRVLATVLAEALAANQADITAETLLDMTQDDPFVAEVLSKDKDPVKAILRFGRLDALDLLKDDRSFIDEFFSNEELENELKRLLNR